MKDHHTLLYCFQEAKRIYKNSLLFSFQPVIFLTFSPKNGPDGKRVMYTVHRTIGTMMSMKQEGEKKNFLCNRGGFDEVAARWRETVVH